MARREAGGGRMVKLSEARKGELLVSGYWIGRHPSSKFPGQEIFDFIEKSTGEMVAIPGSGMLKHKLETYADDRMYCEVYYEGKEAIKSGTWAGQNAHNFRVIVDDEDFYQGGSGSKQQAEADSDEDYTDDDEGDLL